MGRTTTTTAKAKVTAAKKRVTRAKRTPATKDVYKIRRILAQRNVKRGKHEEREFLVDWYPQWQHEEHIDYDKEALKEWDTNSKNGHTFNFKNDLVYKCSNPTEDDGAYHVRLLTNGVLRQFKNWMMRLPHVAAAELFKVDADWAFASSSHKTAAEDVPRRRGVDKPNARQVIYSAYIRERELRSGAETTKEPNYGQIKLGSRMTKFQSEYDLESDIRKLFLPRKQRRDYS